jgi:hypothetical protein
MQKLFRKVAELLIKHPILWLPYITADLFAICLWRLRGLAEKGIFHWFTTNRSVLGGENVLPSNDHAALGRASIAYAPIGIATIVAVVCLFVAALVVTATMVNAIERTQKPSGRKVLADLAVQWRKIFLFALWFLIVFISFAAATAGLSIYLFILAHHQYLPVPFWLEAGLALVTAGCGAWLVTPALMRLLRKGGATSVSIRKRNRVAILAILAAEAGLALGFFMSKMEASMFFNSQWQITAISVLNSVVANAPDALLFVALALLAVELPMETESGKDSKHGEFLPVLMPLHFGKSEEPLQAGDRPESE